MTKHIKVQLQDHAAIVTLNRADKLNAFDLPMWRGLKDAFLALDKDDSVRCVVIRGADAKAFSSGADISEFPTLRNTPEQAMRYAEESNGALQAVAECKHPTVAMIAGVCVGGGLELATMCDMRIAGKTSRFGIPVSRLGLTTNHLEMAGLLRVAGRTVTLELLYEGRVFDAEEALQKGLLNRVVEDDALEAEVDATVRRICGGAPLSARWHKKFVDQLLPGSKLSEKELAQGFECFATNDYRLGYEAFLAKKRPAFQGS